MRFVKYRRPRIRRGPMMYRLAVGPAARLGNLPPPEPLCVFAPVFAPEGTAELSRIRSSGAAARRRVRRSPRPALALRGPARRARAVPAGSGSDLRWLTQLTLPARAGSRRPRPSRGRCADFARCTDIVLSCVGPGSMRVRPSSSADNCPVRGCRGDGVLRRGI